MKRRWMTLDNTQRMVSDDFGKLLKKFREERGMSLQGLANKSGVTASYIHRLETGERRRPGTFILEGIGNALNVDPAILIGIDYRNRNGEEIELGELIFSNKIVYRGRVLDAETKDALLNIMEISLEAKWNSHTILSDLNELGEAINLLKETL